VRARAEREAAELRATMADQLAAANRDLATANRMLDAANKELEQFAYSAAHDLQEPLRMVAMFSQLLQSKYAMRLDETANQYVSYCVEGSRRMQRLIKDLLEYARTTSSEERPSVVVDFNVLVDRALENLDGALKESDADVVRGPLPKLRVEEVRLQQVFQNLVGNAVKYRRPDLPPRIHVSAERCGKEWVFSVSDNGVGIAPQYRDTVFAVFKRLHGANESGTGLGLAICKRIVEHHGGRIWVESEPGQGSTFFFTLPAELEASQA
jgi:light-regulated signal transduction histidine kinase (bacteriophytochrome)